MDDTALIRKWEGFESEPYKCPAGVWTIGFGSVRTPDGDPVTENTPAIDRETAKEWLDIDCERRRTAIRDMVKPRLTEGQYAALLSFAYNLGTTALRNSTLMRKVNAGDIDGAADQFGRWVNAGGRKLQGLVNRREDERRLFLS